jgi:hypothetical protein
MSIVFGWLASAHSAADVGCYVERRSDLPSATRMMANITAPSRSAWHTSRTAEPVQIVVVVQEQDQRHDADYARIARRTLRGSLPMIYMNAWMPVCARPSTSAWMSCVPS